MGHKIILAGLIAALTTAPAFAEESSRDEDIGIGLGATIGVIAGGPIGMVAGAVLGAKVGGKLHQREVQVDALTASLEGSQDRVRDLERDIVALDGDLATMREQARPELLSLLKAGIEMDLLFRTDEHVLADGTEDRLQQLAGSLAAMPDVFVQLDGYADERGDAEYNRKLSIKRAEHVRDVLLANGVVPERISINGHGESPVTEPGVDSYALERKVSLTLYVENSPAFASNPK